MRTGLTLVNYGCPWPGPLHDPLGSATSQLAAAQAFLATHPGQVSLISVDIGSDDLLTLIGSCQGQGRDLQPCLQAGLPTTLETLVHNYGVISPPWKLYPPDGHRLPGDGRRAPPGDKAPLGLGSATPTVGHAGCRGTPRHLVAQ